MGRNGVLRLQLGLWCTFHSDVHPVIQFWKRLWGRICYHKCPSSKQVVRSCVGRLCTSPWNHSPQTDFMHLVRWKQRGNCVYPYPCVKKPRLAEEGWEIQLPIPMWVGSLISLKAHMGRVLSQGNPKLSNQLLSPSRSVTRSLSIYKWWGVM